ncbi:MAG: D-2-hydroxyacid dehydrogenase, partial [Desulfofustis sp.]
MNHLLIFDNDAPTYRAELEEQIVANCDVYATTELEEALQYVPQAEIILGQPALVAKLLPKAERLRWVQSTFAGIEPLCKPDLRTDYKLTGVKDIFGTLMREYVLGYILARERSLLKTRQNQLNRVWERIKYRSLAELTIGIVGLGSIGKSIARTASHFDMRVLGMKRTAAQIDGIERLYLPTQIDVFLPQLDYLVLILPDTAESRNFITGKELLMMKKSAVLINVGRGVTVNQEDLIEALENKRIGGAILDVFETEPLAVDNPLWAMEDVVVT